MAASRFYIFINKTIYVIHEMLIALRSPWLPKSENSLDLSKFDLVFEDNFEGEKLNPEVWNKHLNGEEGVRKGGFWDSEQAFLKDGKLIIRTEYKADGKFGPGYYSANVSTRGAYEQTYGYFECRCKLPAAQGLWSAFWLMTQRVDDFVPGEVGTEIDVYESPMWWRGKKNKENRLVTSNLHYGGYLWGHRYKNVAITKVPDPYNSFNTYGVEWNEKEYIFYINGRETGRSKFGGVCKTPEYFRCSVEVDGDNGVPTFGWSGIITNSEKHELPADYVIDYVRAYQYKTVEQ